MRSTNGIGTHILKNLYLSPNCIGSRYRAKCALVMVHTNTFYLDRPTVQQEAFLGIKIKIAISKGCVIRIDNVSVYLHFGAYGIEIRVINIPKRW